MLPETGYEGAVCAAEKIRIIMMESPFVTRVGDAW